MHSRIQNSHTYVLIVCMFFGVQSFAASFEQDEKSTYMEVARTQLGFASDNYNKGDIEAARENLKHASDWLSRSLEHTRSDTVRDQAKQLAAEIELFRSQLSQSSEQRVISRFWHQITSLINREAENLIHSYEKQYERNQILKSLLDARMHLVTAEHDLFISQNFGDSKSELEKSLGYLTNIESSEIPDVNDIVKKLIEGISELLSLSSQSENAWKQNKMIHALENAASSLHEAKSIATPTAATRIDAILRSIEKFKKETLLASIKAKYDTIRTELDKVIRLL